MISERTRRTQTTILTFEINFIIIRSKMSTLFSEDASLKSKVGAFFRYFDSSGKQVAFNFKGKERLDTVFGGFLTLASYFIILAYVSSAFIMLINKESTFQNITQSKNIVESVDEYVLDKTNYITAIKVRKIADTGEKPLNIAKYFRVIHTQESFVWD